jgi:hypothetical protein
MRSVLLQKHPTSHRNWIKYKTDSLWLNKAKIEQCSRWPSDLQTEINADKPLTVSTDASDLSVYLSSSPAPFCPEGREIDIDAIVRHIDQAQEFIHVRNTT